MNTYVHYSNVQTIVTLFSSLVFMLIAVLICNLNKKKLVALWCFASLLSGILIFPIIYTFTMNNNSVVPADATSGAVAIWYTSLCINLLQFTFLTNGILWFVVNYFKTSSYIDINSDLIDPNAPDMIIRRDLIKSFATWFAITLIFTIISYGIIPITNIS